MTDTLQKKRRRKVNQDLKGHERRLGPGQMSVGRSAGSGSFSQAQKLQEMFLTAYWRRGTEKWIRIGKGTKEGCIYPKLPSHGMVKKNLSRILTLDSNQGGCLLGDLLDQATKLTLALRSQKGRSVDWKFLHLFHTRFSQVQKRQEILLTPSQRTDRRGK